MNDEFRNRIFVYVWEKVYSESQPDALLRLIRETPIHDRWRELRNAGGTKYMSHQHVYLLVLIHKLGVRTDVPLS